MKKQFLMGLLIGGMLVGSAVGQKHKGPDTKKVTKIQRQIDSLIKELEKIQKATLDSLESTTDRSMENRFPFFNSPNPFPGFRYKVPAVPDVREPDWNFPELPPNSFQLPDIEPKKDFFLMPEIPNIPKIEPKQRESKPFPKWRIQLLNDVC